MNVGYTISDKYRKEYDKLMSEAPFERDIQKTLETWKNKRFKQILRLDGSRQVGKTTELLKFGFRHYENILYINLTEPGVVDAFNNSFQKGKTYFSAMHEYFGDYVDDETTLFIIDEIQLSSDIYNRLKEFKRQLSCDVIVTGSYLGRVINQHDFEGEDTFNLFRNKSEYFVPVGTITSVRLYPLSFKEFCLANGKEISSDEIEKLEWSNKLSDLYTTYTMIGGYPSVVLEYIHSSDIYSCYEILDSILERFKEESRYFFNSDKSVLVFDSIYQQLTLEMMKEADYTYSTEKLTEAVKDSYKDLKLSRKDISIAINWLIAGGILGTCNRYNEGNPSKISYNTKIYFSDCGLLNSICQNVSVNNSHLKGVVAETFAFNELRLICENKQKRNRKVMETVVHYAKHGNYELDFMLHGAKGSETENHIFGIEIKSGDSSHKSLDFFKKEGLITKKVVAADSVNTKQIGSNFLKIPIYLVGIAFPYEKSEEGQILSLF